MPSAPATAGHVASGGGDLKWSPISEKARIFSRSALVRIGWRTSRRLTRDMPSRSNRFGRGPMIETRLMTSSSRIGSIGGVVASAEFFVEEVNSDLGVWGNTLVVG